MITLDGLLDAAVAALAARFVPAPPALPAAGQLREVVAHGGRFDLDELLRHQARTPCLRVAIAEVELGEGPESTVQMLAGLVVADRPQLPRARHAAQFVRALLGYLPGQRWGLAGVRPAAAIRARSLYDGQIDTAGVALWQLQWVHRVDSLHLID